MTDKTKRKCIANWLTFNFFAVLVPLLVAWQAFAYFENVMTETSLRRYQIEATDLLERLRISADANLYICTLMNSIFTDSKGPKQLQKTLVEFRESSGLQFEYLIWGKNGGIVAADFDWKCINADWQYAWRTLYDIGHRRREVAAASETANLREIFGPQFFPELHAQCYSGRNIRLISSDSSLQKKLTWIRMRQNKSLVVFFDHSLLKGIPGLELQIKLAAAGSNLRLGVVKDGQWLGSDRPDLTPDELAAICKSYDNPYKVRNWYVFKNAMRTDLHGICYIDTDKIDRLVLGRNAQVAVLVLVVMSLFVLWRSFLVFCCGKSLSISIRKQLIILFVLSNAISLLIMALIGFDYIGQYRLFLQTEGFSKGVTYLQSIDEMFVGEFARQLRRMNKALARLKPELEQHPPTRRMIVDFLAQQSKEPFRLYLIGSNTPYIGSENGVMKNGKFVEEVNMDWERYKAQQTLVDSMGKLGSYYLSLLNRTTIPEMQMAQVELIAESLGQLRPIEMFQEFFAATGSFWQWGMGLRYYPAYIEVIRHSKTGLANYVFLYLWKADLLQREYIDRLLTNFNRNPLGLKIMAVDEDFYYANPPEMLKNEQLLMYSAKLREKNGTEIDFCDWDGEKHLLMGLKCTSLDTMRLIGLYPTATIDRQVQQKKWIFVALAIVSILVSLAMGLFVARSVLMPLAELQHGIQALQKRDFAFRLPDLGGDEFGDLAKVFNTTLVDLEELHVASTVQEKLSDSMSEPATAGKLTYFGAESSQSQFGGDYLEIDQLADQRVMILTGDVAGHGIGVSLITAFMKAALLQLVDLYGQPDKLLCRLDVLLRELSSRARRKFMTMQCVLLNTQTAEITIANAGHCFPIVINRSTRDAKIIDMPSTPLGAGKIADCRVVKIKLSADESLVLYTGGLYRNGEAGFLYFLDSLLKCNNICPKAWHDAVMAEVFSRVAAEDCDDDMTLVVINCNDTTAARQNIV
ncbi:MAG: SpoIIE family protein phosphatase [Candidatus Riflebacteria bacterium]|nr:SpoIIE family protein phosphatase [Candidatus Riflebacteria bacterium]